MLTTLPTTSAKHCAAQCFGPQLECYARVIDVHDRQAATTDADAFTDQSLSIERLSCDDEPHTGSFRDNGKHAAE